MPTQWQELKRIDPLGRQPDRGSDIGSGSSPMDPPDAYAPPGLEPVSAAALHPFLGTLRHRHVPMMEALSAFEETILSIQKNGYTRESDAGLRQFFHCFDEAFSPRSRRREAALFALLHERLIADGEHSKGEIPTTAIDLMEDDCAKSLQLAAVVLNFLGLVFRLPDEKSRLVVLDAALEEGRNLIELLRLLIFRMDNVVVSLAHRLISAAEFDQMQARMAGAIKAN